MSSSKKSGLNEKILNLPLKEVPYCAVDIETTGTSFKKDEIIEIAIVRYKTDEKLLTFSTLIKAETPISPHASAIHGIKEEDLKNAPYFHEVANKIHNLLKDCILVGHNITNLDLSFINREFKKSNLPPILNYTLDTVYIGRYLLKTRKNKSLKDLAKALDIKTEKLHRALPDAHTTMKIWQKALDWFLREGFKTLQDLAIKRLIDSGYSPKGLEILRIIRQYRFIKIVYQSPFSGKTERVIEPLAVRGKSLDAYCHLREDFRSFYLDRIISIEVIG